MPVRISPTGRRPRLRGHHPTGSTWWSARSVPTDAPVTVVFAHGFCMNMGAFHFQRCELARVWGDQVRMVFYDQRGHGRSSSAAPRTYTVAQLGCDLDCVLNVLARRRSSWSGIRWAG